MLDEGLNHSNFEKRHIGMRFEDEALMLNSLGFRTLEDFVNTVIPADILTGQDENYSIPNGCDEIIALEELRVKSRKNKVIRSLIGLGYFGTVTPPSIQRNVLENPSWYTAYTPYQSEIAQGRLEALFNFQTLISELTGLPIANASLLDEATAAAEAMSMSFAVKKEKNARRFLVDKNVLPQTLSVLQNRAEPLDISLEIVDPKNIDLNAEVFGLLLQLPDKRGVLFDPSFVINKVHSVKALVTTVVDPLAQVLIKPVGELGADIAVGSTQRFGIPMAFGGPHAAFFATKEDFKRSIPGRLVGQSIDVDNLPALRLALQTREQHIRRDKATSNICTAQVLLAIIASFYAVYHGPDGLNNIAIRVCNFKANLESFLRNLGYKIEDEICFDTIEIYAPESPLIHKLAALEDINLRVLPLGSNYKNATGFGITFDELTNEKELSILKGIFSKVKDEKIDDGYLSFKTAEELLPGIPLRDKNWLQQPVFNKYQSETELMRYIYLLASKDFSLVHGMIPLGSCTMKLNSAAELIPIGWREFALMHPFAPKDQLFGYYEMIADLENWLADLTGFAGVSLQPNAGSQGEFAGLLIIREWHKSCGQDNRNVCLIPKSAHGTNPASAIMSGFSVVSVDCDNYGNVDIKDLCFKAKKHSKDLAALMLTYPSTHGVFEPQVKEICEIIHAQGGQVYLDGANFNAQVGLCRPGEYGADVCHLNLHKTFAIPHGGGGPGLGPVAVASHLVPYLPTHDLVKVGGSKGIKAVSAAPFGSAGILPISWMYIRMMGSNGLRKATSIAILSANYIAKKLDPYFPVLFKGTNGLVAHECILDFRKIKTSTGIEVEDIAKRLMDYGFHAPTVSWPVAGTLMVEPTESESLEEIERFCSAMISISMEIKQIQSGLIDKNNNPLKRSPHTLSAVTATNWDRPYSREEAVFPLPDQQGNKFWPAVSRINNAFGDRNLICSCISFEEFTKQ